MKFKSSLIFIAVIVGAFIYFAKSGGSIPLPLSTSTPKVNISPSASPQKYQCAGKTRCSEMNSCEEATFYLQNCPNVQIDGDGDGIPCEKQWCRP